MNTTVPLPWQQSLWDQMTARAVNNRLAHAFLLKGVSGLGKMHFAKTFAHWLLCELVGDLPCGKCKGCLLVQAGSHPDLLIVEPEEAGKMIKVDQVRRLNSFAQKTAQQGGRRVIIVSPAEAMNVNASNALLKCLEEPGAETLFLLVGHRSGDILPTIRSRCQALAFSVPSHAVAKGWLQLRVNSPQQVELLLKLAADSPLQALQMAENCVLEQRDKLIKSVSALFRGELTAVELGKEWQGKDCVLVLEWLSSWLEDIARFSLTRDQQHIRNHDLVKLLQYLAGKSEPRQIMDLREWLLNQRHLLVGGANLNQQLVAEGVFCRLLGLVM